MPACGPTPANPVAALASATHVYAFEPGQVFAYRVGGDGLVTEILGSRFRAARSDWLLVTPDPFGRFLFGVADQGTALFSYRVDASSGELRPASEDPHRAPAGYTYTAAASTPSGRFLYLGADPPNTWWGRVVGLAIDPGTGLASEVPGSPFATAIGTHRLWIDPQSRFLYVSNAAKRPGGPECLSGYRMDATTGALSEMEGSPFKTVAFINQMEFDPSGRFVYATAGHFLLAFRIADDGALEPLPVPEEPEFEPVGTYVFSLVASRDGQFLFAFQQSGWILSYRIDHQSGALTFVGELRGTPGYVAWLLHPEGTLALTLSAAPPSLHVHRIDGERGLLTMAGSPLSLGEGATPHMRGQRLLLDAAGRHLGVVVRRPGALADEVALLSYRIDLAAGTLTPVSSLRLGETSSPLVAAVAHAPAWRP